MTLVMTAEEPFRVGVQQEIPAGRIDIQDVKGRRVRRHDEIEILAIAVLADVEPESPRESIAPPHNESRADRVELPHELNDIHKKPDRIHEWPLGVQPTGRILS